MAEAARVIVNRNQVAQVFGVQPNTITKWVQRGMPVLQEGRQGLPWRFDVEHCVTWRRAEDEREHNAKHGLTEDHPVDLSLERARLARAQTESAELRNATLRGELVPAREVLEHWAGMIVAATTHLRAVPSQLKGEIPHLTAEEVMIARGLIDRACTELADGLPEHAADDLGTGDGEVEATA